MRRRAVAVAFLGAALVLAGCGGGEETTGRVGADTTNGKELFIEKCGSCHVLSDAGTQGTTGPNLDDAFGYPRLQGFDETTFYDITLQQIDLAAPPMPADLVTGQDAVDVAAYVAQAAKVQGAPPAAPSAAP
ncbi:MAG TPA: c-type cytochrome [Gaiellaceae bacterium]|nr:c-type cytochrome [Gaiellaceae bacterium]